MAVEKEPIEAQKTKWAARHPIECYTSKSEKHFFTSQSGEFFV